LPQEYIYIPKAANEAMRMPTTDDFLPWAIPSAFTTAPPPGMMNCCTGSKEKNWREQIVGPGV
jgi:hypothetical protein